LVQFLEKATLEEIVKLLRREAIPFRFSVHPKKGQAEIFGTGMRHVLLSPERNSTRFEGGGKGFEKKDDKKKKKNNRSYFKVIQV